MKFVLNKIAECVSVCKKMSFKAKDCNRVRIFKHFSDKCLEKIIKYCENKKFKQYKQCRTMIRWSIRCNVMIDVNSKKYWCEEHEKQRYQEHKDYHLVQKVYYGMVYPIERAHIESQLRTIYEYRYMFDQWYPCPDHQDWKKKLEQRIGGIYFLDNNVLKFLPTDVEPYSECQMKIDKTAEEYYSQRQYYEIKPIFTPNQLIKQLEWDEYEFELEIYRLINRFEVLSIDYGYDSDDDTISEGEYQAYQQLPDFDPKEGWPEWENEPDVIAFEQQQQQQNN